jgi:aspartokinase-like uncharacterized kinase
MIRVVKVGGSLLDWPQLPVALRQWLAEQSPAFHIVIAGGGTVAEVIRKADRDFRLSEELSHWLCVDGLSINARILAAVMPQYPLVSRFADVRAESSIKQGGGVIFDPREFLVDQESLLPGRCLPHDWTATSDSIGARIAISLPADELVLLKSCDAPAATHTGLAAAGYVDHYFPTAAAELPPPRFVNLRGCNIRGSAL